MRHSCLLSVSPWNIGTRSRIHDTGWSLGHFCPRGLEPRSKLPEDALNLIDSDPERLAIWAAVPPDFAQVRMRAKHRSFASDGGEVYSVVLNRLLPCICFLAL